MDKVKEYFKNFKYLIPTWFICIFIFFWIYRWTLIVGIFLLCFQIFQIRNIYREIDGLYEDIDSMVSKDELVDRDKREIKVMR